MTGDALRVFLKSSIRITKMHAPTYPCRHGFTLIELMVTIAIVAILAVLFAAIAPGLINRGHKSASLNNLRQIGTGMMLYLGENDNVLPGRVTSGDKWPALLHVYLQDTKVYASPGDPENFIARSADPLSNARNETSYIMNGYNDLGALSDETVSVRANTIDRPSQVILLGTPNPGSGQFYMDMLEGGGNHIEVLNLEAYGNGSNYLFADRSAKFLTGETYSHRMWLVNQEFEVP